MAAAEAISSADLRREEERRRRPEVLSVRVKTIIMWILGTISIQVEHYKPGAFKGRNGSEDARRGQTPEGGRRRGDSEGRRGGREGGLLPPSPLPHEPRQSGERRNEPFALPSSRSLAHPVAAIRASTGTKTEEEAIGSTVIGGEGKAERGDDVCLELSGATTQNTFGRRRETRAAGKGYISSLSFLVRTYE